MTRSFILLLCINAICNIKVTILTCTRWDVVITGAVICAGKQFFYANRNRSLRTDPEPFKTIQVCPPEFEYS